jgi:hypothetical protein
MAIFQKLEQLPSRRQHYLGADYVELRALVALGGEYSASDLVEDWKRYRDLNAEDPEDGLPLLDPEAADGHDEAAEGEAGEPEATAHAARDDRLVDSSLEVWEHLMWRAEEFADWYPFEVRNDDERRTLTLREQLTPLHLVYLFLLLASSLDHIAPTERVNLTKPFERMSKTVVQVHVPPHAEVHIFGTSSGDHDRYEGNLFTKYTKLAADLSCELRVREGELDPNNTGDGGLDIVVWVPLGDTEPEIPIWFVQCGVGKDWKDKQAATSEHYWSKRLTLAAPILSVTTIPYCYRVPGGGWVSPSSIAKGVLFDRLRFVRALEVPPAQRLPLPDFPVAFMDQATSGEEKQLAA